MRHGLISTIVLALFSFVGRAESQQIVPLVEEKSAVSFREDLVWNKWDTKNFIVLSLDKRQGVVLKGVVEEVRLSFFDSWGLPVDDSLVPCKLVCVPDRQTLQNLFSVDSPRCEVRHAPDGKVSTCAIWVDYENIHMLPYLVASVSVSDSVCPFKLSPVFQNGMVSLSGPVQSVRSLLGSRSSVDSRSLFSIKGEAWSSSKDKEGLNRKCALFCLMIRKELGSAAFSSFAMGDQSEDSVKKALGFTGHDELSKTLERYSENLAGDISKERTPDEYLVIGN
jgi:hypothetical protein